MVDGLKGKQTLFGIPQRDLALVVGCMAGMTLMLVLGSLATRSLPSLLDSGWNVPDNLHTLASAIVYAVLALVAYWRLEALQYQAVTGAALGATVAYVALLASGELLGSPILIVVGTVLYSVVNVLISYLFALSLLRLPSLKAATVVVIGGVIMRQLALPLYSIPLGELGSFLAMGGVSVAAVFVLAAIVRPLFGPFANRETLALLELTNPLSSLWPPARLFVITLLVPLTYGFSNSLGVPGFSVRRMVVVFVLLAMLWMLLVQHDGQEDRLFSLVALFIMAGLLVAPVVLDADTFIAHTFLFLASSSYSILLWLLIYGLGKRNIAAMVPVFGLLMSLSSLGGFVGGALGRASIGSADMPLIHVQTVILLLALAFFAFVWLGIRDFSFSEAIRGVETTENLEVGAQKELETPQQDPDSPIGTSAADQASMPADGSDADVHTRVDAPKVPTQLEQGIRPDVQQLATQSPSREAHLNELAKQVQLTPREIEIFRLLAQGRNAKYLMDHLHITRNTAKAHISHIYTKLGVHSHQELLSLVEDNILR